MVLLGGFYLSFVGDINYKQIRHKFVATENNYLQFNDKHTPVAGSWVLPHITHILGCVVLAERGEALIIILSLHTYSMYSFEWPTTAKQHPGSNIRAE